ncbi:alanine racemase [Pseudomonas otitidis]|uniref:alanine racemase n=1 Tax=Metapseudomonas otitidis TaxID=319939 RepID=UPI0024AE31CE|nr:alanine racemase [Pseudomonas otitidis]MDI6528752.1 alanine racemase [Pseudomonas otitidis]
MKRRQLLAGLGALGALGLWAARPADQGAPHAPYFAQLQGLLRQQGGGVPQLVIDLDRLDANADLLSSRLGGMKLRLVSKSLASTGLLDYLSKRLGTRRFMVFHQPQANQLAEAFPDSDLLLGKPLPVAAALAFYQQLAANAPFDPDRQVTWLVDSPERLVQYRDMAIALQRPLSIALEIDIGLRRGGHSSPERLAASLALVEHSPEVLNLRGLMGYDGHVAHAPFWVGDAFDQANARYRDFLEQATHARKAWPETPLLNGAGSLTCMRHLTGPSPLNEIAVGSVLLKPSDFEAESLDAYQAACWIAAPVLKAGSGTLPYLEDAQRLVSAWNPNREQAFYLYGGYWQAIPASPAGLAYDPLYGRSANQERLIGSAANGLQPDDWVFLRPQVSEGLLARFGSMSLLRRGRLVGRWKPLPTA